MNHLNLEEQHQEHEKEEDEVIIDIPLLMKNSSKEGSEPSIYTKWSVCCIYRVPKNLRLVNEAAYTPQLVSIGPFHHGSPELSPMEKLKSSYRQQFCRRTSVSGDVLRRAFDESKVRACYAGTFKMTSDRFADMILTDACFVIELLIRNWENDTKDYILEKPWLKKSIELDLILIENQLPFFVLEEIYNCAKAWDHIRKAPEERETQRERNGSKNRGKNCNCCFKPTDSPEKENSPNLRQEERSKNCLKNCSSCIKSKHLTFLHLTRHYFSSHHFKYEGDITEVTHITDLLRSYFCPPGDRLSTFKTRDGVNISLRTATLLDQAGVDFEVVGKTYLSNITFEKGRLLTHFPCFNCSWLLNCLPCLFHSCPGLRFRQPTLKLPEIEIDDSTERVFRNLMAFEQCHYPNEAYICNYVWLMDKLINTRDDVDLLVEKKVIVNFMGSSKEVADLFNALSRRIVETSSCYYSCVEKINDHCKNPVNRIMATFTSVYFRDFWRGTATVVGVIVLVLTVWSFLRRILMR